MFKQVTCDGAIYTVPESLYFQCPNVKPCKPIVVKNPWNVLHERYADAIKSKQWDERYERKWLDEVFLGLVPCGECRERWKPISDSMDLSTAESAFTAAWQAHNRVSTQHVQPQLPVMDYQQCRNLWMGPKVAFVAVDYATHGGTETFHRTLLPSLRHFRNVIGFAAITGGGNGQLLKVPYFEGANAAIELCKSADIVVAWGIAELESLLPELNRPKVIGVHHSDASSEWSNANVTQNCVDEIVCVNEFAAEHLRQITQKPVHHIANAVDPLRIKPTENYSKRGKKICLFGHRFAKEKRPQLAVEIARHLPEDWLMVMAGDGPEKPLNVPANVRLVGHVDNLANWLAVADCFISLSTYDGFGLSMAEAHAMGVPVVATPVGIAEKIAAKIVPLNASVKEWSDSILCTHLRALPNQPADFSVTKHVADWVQVLSGFACSEIPSIPTPLEVGKGLPALSKHASTFEQFNV